MAEVSRKKFMNNVDNCVRESLKGFVLVNSGLRLLETVNVILRHDLEEVKKKGKVTLISGGGSGHEPAAAGFVGQGMLSASVHGAIFASPPAAVILTCLRVVAKNNPAGTIVIVLNYTGDRLNFGLAVERAKLEGLNVDMAVVGEDCALISQDKTAGRRGLCGAVLIFKIAGAMAEEGKSLKEIKSTIMSAASNMGTIGISLSSCSVPGSGLSFVLQPDEMELGLGIHSEAGVSRLKVCSAAETIKIIVNHMTKEGSSSRFNLKPGLHLCLVVNNLGGTSQLEMNIVAKEAIEYLERLNVHVEKVYCGTFVTSLEMAGISLTLLTLHEFYAKYLDAETNAPSWPRPYLTNGSKTRETVPELSVPDSISHEDVITKAGSQLSQFGQEILSHALSTACQALISSDRQLNLLDKEAGDGDCGATLKSGAQEILHKLQENELPLNYPKSTMLRLAHCAEMSMGGCSGGLYSLFFTGASQAFDTECSPSSWCEAINLGMIMITKYGSAEVGDRTMLDALSATYSALHQCLKENMTNENYLESFGAAVKATEVAAAATANLKARAGRASYVDPSYQRSPDPGAHAVGIWMRAIYEGIKQKMKPLPK